MATETDDGRTVFWKAVNPEPRAVAVTLKTSGDWAVGKARLRLVNPGDLKARNTLEKPDRIAPVAGAVQVEQGVVQFSLPPLSAAVVRLTKG